MHSSASRQDLNILHSTPSPDHAKHSQTIPPSPSHFLDPRQIPSFPSPDLHRPSRPTSRCHFSRAATGRIHRSPSGALGSITSLPSCATHSTLPSRPARASRSTLYSCSWPSLSSAAHIRHISTSLRLARSINPSPAAGTLLTLSLLAIIPFHGSPWTAPSWRTTRLREARARSPTLHPDASDERASLRPNTRTEQRRAGASNSLGGCHP